MKQRTESPVPNPVVVKPKSEKYLAISKRAKNVQWITPHNVISYIKKDPKSLIQLFDMRERTKQLKYVNFLSS